MMNVFSKRVAYGLMAGLVMLSTPGFAQEEWGQITANVAIASDYIWRGKTQTRGDFAYSGGIDIGDPSGNGVYIGMWASNVDGDADGFVDLTFPNFEVDLYAGYAGQMGEFNYDISGNYYYFDERNWSFSEFAVMLGYGPVSGKIWYLINSDSDGERVTFSDGERVTFTDSDSVYYELNYDTTAMLVNTEVSIGLHAGAYRISSKVWSLDTPSVNYPLDIRYEDYKLSFAVSNIFSKVMDMDMDGSMMMNADMSDTLSIDFITTSGNYITTPSGQRKACFGDDVKVVVSYGVNF